MATHRTATGARLALTGYAVVAAAAAVFPTLPGGAVHVVLHVTNVLRAIGHGTFAVEDGLVLAAVVSVATTPLPSLVAAVGRASRPVPTRTATARALVGSVVGAGLVAARSATPLSTCVSLVLATAVGLALGALLLAARRELRDGPADVARGTWRSRRVALVLAGVYGIGVAVVGFAGSPVDAGAQPLLLRSLDALHRAGLPAWFGYAATEVTANVLFFLPLGLLVVLLLGARRWWVGAAAGFLVSLAVEVVQTAFLPARSGSVDDVLANTGGAVVGALVGVVVLGRTVRRRGAARSAASAPRA